MKIHKIINNSVVSVLNDHGEELILTGKGISFQKKIGEEIDEARIEKRFSMDSIETNNKLQQLLKDIPLEHLQMADSIIEYAKAALGKKLNDTLYISLSDHIYTSINRFLDGIALPNSMLWEVKRFYDAEFEIGLKALDMIEEKFNIRLPEDEAGFIAMHIVDSSMDGGSIEQVYETTRIIQGICNLVKYYFNIDFDSKSVYYYRFLTHLRFFAQRLVTEKMLEKRVDDDLYEMIKTKYNNAFNCVTKIEKFIEKNYDYILTNEEKMYLTIHIEQVIYKTSK